AVADTLRQQRDALRDANAPAKHDFGGAFGCGGQQLPFDHVLDLVRAEHRKDDGIAALRQIANAGGSTAAGLRELRVFGAIDIEAHDREARAKQAAHECLAQQAEANYADRLGHESASALCVAAIAAINLSRPSDRRTSTERRDGEVARSRVEALAPRLGPGGAIHRSGLHSG